MGYIEPSTRKVNKNKKPLVETLVSKKFWVLLNKKNKIYYSMNGSIVMFSRLKDAKHYMLEEPDIEFKLEKLDVIITR